MKSKLSIIYVPGLGGSNVSIQGRIIGMWRLFGVRPVLVQMLWEEHDSWTDKLQRLIDKIDELTMDGQKISLIGASAGGSAVINAYSMRQSVVIGCVLLSAKVNNPNSIGRHYHDKYPALKESVDACVESLAKLNSSNRSKIMSRYAYYDPIVSSSDSIIPGGKNKRIMTFGHSFSIGFQLIFGAPSFLRFLKKLNNRT